jgi:hypothetical protein
MTQEESVVIEAAPIPALNPPPNRPQQTRLSSNRWRLAPLPRCAEMVVRK